LVNAQDQKRKLEEIMTDLQAKLVIGGNALAAKEKEQASKYRKF